MIAPLALDAGLLAVPGAGGAAASALDAGLASIGARPLAIDGPYGDLVRAVFMGAAAVFVALALAMLYRAVKGPTMQDRVLAVNVLGTNTVVVLALLSVGLAEKSLLDVALIYALLNFLMAVAISKFTVDRGGVI